MSATDKLRALQAEVRAITELVSAEHKRLGVAPYVPPARPVKVGDEVRCERHYPKQIGNVTMVGRLDGRPVFEVRFALHAFATIDAVTFDLDDPNLTHADGAPIDVPATLAALAKPAISEDSLGDHSFSAEHLFAAAGRPRVLTDPTAISEAERRELANLRRRIGEEVKAASDERERANRLSDKAGALETDLREAHETIGRQAREIERLQRVIRGRK